MSGAKSQRKGRNAELELARLLQAQGYTSVKPGEPISFGRTPDMTGLSFIHPEIKRHERLNLSAAMAQAVEDADKFQDGFPAVFHRRNRETWLVSMRLLDWLQLYQAYYEKKCTQKGIVYP